MYMEKYVSITNNERICYETVNKCPICNSSIAPVEKSKFFNSDSKMYFFMFECPACNKGFITHYNYTNERKIKNDISYNMLKLVNSYPKVPELHQFDENIKKLSSNFCEIFNQAYVAEQMNLNEIAGMDVPVSLSESQQEVLNIWNNLDEKEQNVVIQMLRGLQK